MGCIRNEILKNRKNKSAAKYHPGRCISFRSAGEAIRIANQAHRIDWTRSPVVNELLPGYNIYYLPGHCSGAIRHVPCSRLLCSGSGGNYSGTPAFQGRLRGRTSDRYVRCACSLSWT
jgi:hypothetical protein